MIIIDYPPIPKGTPEEQMHQMYRYLFRLAQALNQANLADGDRPDVHSSADGAASASSV